jgi:flagellar assembly factor FliW
MTIDTKAYGQVEVDERQRITIPFGLYGFESLSGICPEWMHDNAPSTGFSPVDVRDVAFVLIDPKVIRQDYDADIEPRDFEALELEDSEDERFLQFAIVTIPEDRQEYDGQSPGAHHHQQRESESGDNAFPAAISWHVRA